MKKAYVIFILLISLFLIGGCSTNIKDEETVKVEKRELAENEKSSLMEVINKLAYMDYYNKDVVPRNMANQEILRLSYEILALEGKVASGELNFSDLENVAMNYFGYGLEPENLVCDTHYNIQDAGGADIMIYNVETGVYTNNSNHLGHGSGGLRTEVYNNYVEGDYTDGTYTIVVNKLFSGLLGEPYDSKLSYYATYGDAINSKNELFKSNMIDLNKFNEYQDKLVKYTYTFQLKDDNYVLTSYKIG